MHDRPFLRRTAWAAAQVFALVVGAGCSTAGCASPLGAAVRAYEQGRYPEAMDELRAIEPHTPRFAFAEAGRYALYRGLTHLALGDLRATSFWFSRIEHAMNVEPTLFSAGDVERFASARAHLPADYSSPAQPRRCGSTPRLTTVSRACRGSVSE